MPEPGDYETGIPGLTLYRRENPNIAEEEGCAEAHATIVFQGAENVRINGRDYICHPCQCRVTAHDTVGSGYIAEASSESPFLAASLAINKDMIDELAERICRISPKGGGPCSGPARPRPRPMLSLKNISVEETDPGIMDAFLRLIRVLKRPLGLPVLAPDIIYEIHYLLLIGPHGRFIP